MKNPAYIIILLLSSYLFSSCSTEATDQNKEEVISQAPIAERNTPKPGLLTFSQKQVEAIGLKLGSFQTIKVSGFIQANGVLDLPLSNIASINAPQSGFIRKTRYLPGDKVSKGTILAQLEHPDYIQIQEQFLDTKSQLGYLKQELNRQQRLAAANVSAQKKLQETEANYVSTSARYQSLAKRIAYLDIDTNQVLKGELISYIDLRAPFSGYITAVNTHLGKYVEPNMPLYEMVNMEHVHIELDVFEKDILNIKKGQKITFTLPGTQSSKRYEGVVHLINKKISEGNRTIRVHGDVSGKHPEFVKGMYVEARIWQNEKTVNALPEESIVSLEGREVIFIHSQSDSIHSFQVITVISGSRDQGMVETQLTEEIPSDANIVTEGAYYLKAELEKSGSED